jgi:hypothetical protein
VWLVKTSLSGNSQIIMNCELVQYRKGDYVSFSFANVIDKKTVFQYNVKWRIEEGYSTVEVVFVPSFF